MPILTRAPVLDWLRLWRLVQQSLSSSRRLLQSFPGPGAALGAAPAMWRELGIAPALVERLAAWQYGDDPAFTQDFDAGVAADLAWCEAPDQGLLAIDHDAYPALLREIADPPPVLFFKGDPVLLGLPQVAVVGTRHPSLTGRADAEAFAGELAHSGLVITSGLARGVDTAAHQGALRARGRTVAVLGTGADRPYPRENTRLYQAIVANGGLLVSEFLPGAQPLAMHFPRRNRIISGLSLGVLVVEAAPESGSLITARRAAEQGRPVWVLPGSRHNVQAQGCLRLIREGAAPVTEIAHILADLPPLLHLFREEIAAAEARPAHVDLPTSGPGAELKPESEPEPELEPEPEPEPELELELEQSSEIAGNGGASLEPALRQVLAALGEEPRHPDKVIDLTGQPAPQVLQALSRLEIAGLIAAVPGGYSRHPSR